MIPNSFPQTELFKKHLESLPLKEVQQIFEQTVSKKPEIKQIKPLKRTPSIEKEKQDLTNLGLQLISKGKVAVLMMAGGQGTRLGYDKPKGMFDIGLPSHKSLFQIYCEKLISLENWVKSVCGDCKPIKFLIMTSEQNQEEVLHYFEQHHYFDKKLIYIFPQSASYPILSLDCKLVLESPNKVLLGPNGNGAFLESMHSQGLLKQLEQEGVEYLHFVPVDNVLIRLADPLWVGHTARYDYMLSSKQVKKVDPHEKVGIHVEINGKAAIVEYSEMSEKDKLLKKGEELVFNSGGIGQMICTIKFLIECSNRLEELQKNYHAAKKMNRYYDPISQQYGLIESYKFELFYFDIFCMCPIERFGVLEAKREEEFAPVKNASGDSSPETARLLYSNNDRKILEGKGVKFEGDGLVEIDQKKTYLGENLEIGNLKEQKVKLPFILK